MTLLLAGAFGPEIAPFAPHLPPTVAARAVGIGLVDAALGTARAIAETSARALVFVGTAGALPGSGLGVHDTVVVEDTVLGDLAAATDAGTLLPGLARPIATHVPLSRIVAPTEPRVRAVTTLTITTSDAAARALAEAHPGRAVEHLEAYAVAAAARQAGIPFAILLGITNTVGSTGRQEWSQNNERTSKFVSERFLSGLRAAASAPLAGLAGAD